MAWGSCSRGTKFDTMAELAAGKKAFSMPVTMATAKMAAINADGIKPDAVTNALAIATFRAMQTKMIRRRSNRSAAWPPNSDKMSRGTNWDRPMRPRRNAPSSIVSPPISVQRRSAKNTKIGDCQCTYFLIVCALNISNFYCFVTICMRV